MHLDHRVTGRAWSARRAVGPRLAAAMLVASTQAMAGYTATQLGSPGLDAQGVGYARALAVNDAGVVAGYMDTYVAGNWTGGRRLFTWEAGTLRSMAVLQHAPAGGPVAVAFDESALLLNDRAHGTTQVVGNTIQVVKLLPTQQNLGAWAYTAPAGNPGNASTLPALGTAAGVGQSFAHAMNAPGQIVGRSSALGNTGLYPRAVLWQDGQVQALGTLGTPAASVAVRSAAYAINDAGQAVGMADLYAGSSYQGTRAFVWQGGVMTALAGTGLDAQGLGRASGNAINAAGAVAGYSSVVTGGLSEGVLPVVWSAAGGMTVLSHDSAAWDYTSAMSSASLRSFIDAAGTQVAGTAYSLASGFQAGYVWSHGSFSHLGAIAGHEGVVVSSTVNGMNDSGLVVGEYSYQPSAGQPTGHLAFVWDHGVMRDLNTLVDAASLDGYLLTGAYDINASGQIAAEGYKAGFGSRAFLLSPTAVPEPAAAALMLAGLGLLGLARRRRAVGRSDDCRTTAG